MKNPNCKYIISFGVKDNIIVAFVALLLDAAAFFLHRQGGGFFIATVVFGGFFTLIFVIGFYRTLFNKIYIYDNYFIHVTSPFKEYIVNDYEVKDAWICQKNPSKGATGYYFNYITNDGVKRKLLVPPTKLDFADYLAERLKGNEVSDYETHIAVESAVISKKHFTFRKILPVLMVTFCVIFFIVMFIYVILYGGNKTPYTAAQVAEIMQSYGYEAVDNTEEMQAQNSSIEHSVYCVSYYPYIEFTFIEMDSDASAKSLFTSLHEQFWEKRRYNTNVGENYYNNYSSMDYHLEDDYYSNIVRVSNTVVLAISKENTQDKIYELLEAMDYDPKTDNFKLKIK